MNAPVQGPAVTAHPLGGIVVEIPGLRLVSEANSRGHTIAKADRIATQRSAVTSTLRVMGGAAPPLPCRVAITRIAPDVLDDDNLASACKAARDAVALWLVPVTQTIRKGPRAGTTRIVGDDRDPRVEWSVAQERGPYGVRVEVVPVRPFGGITTARVVPEGIVTRVECVLGPKATGVLAEALADLARGERQQVTLHVGAVRLVVRAPEKE